MDSGRQHVNPRAETVTRLPLWLRKPTRLPSSLPKVAELSCRLPFPIPGLRDWSTLQFAVAISVGSLWLWEEGQTNTSHCLSQFHISPPSMSPSMQRLRLRICYYLPAWPVASCFQPARSWLPLLPLAQGGMEMDGWYTELPMENDGREWWRFIISNISNIHIYICVCVVWNSMYTYYIYMYICNMRVYCST